MLKPDPLSKTADNFLSEKPAEFNKLCSTRQKTQSKANTKQKNPTKLLSNQQKPTNKTVRHVCFEGVPGRELFP